MASLRSFFENIRRLMNSTGAERAAAAAARAAAAAELEDPTDEEGECAPEGSGSMLNRWYTYGAHIYRQPGERASVVFTNASLGVRRVLVDEQGNIRNFPGISDEALARLKGVDCRARIRFRTDFSREENGCIRMNWQVQPDGRYWGDDDGFGMENDVEIRLCAHIDERGRFTGPFELYQIGRRMYGGDSGNAATGGEAGTVQR